MKPKRIQRQRRKGWRLPANARCVTRPGKFGNPFYVAVAPEDGRQSDPFWCRTAEEAVRRYEEIVLPDTHLCAIIRRELRGFDLACYCQPGATCHADVLLRIANE